MLTVVPAATANGMSIDILRSPRTSRNNRKQIAIVSINYLIIKKIVQIYLITISK